MSNSPTLNFYRLLPRKSEFLDRRIGSTGEFFYDQDAQTLRLYDGRRAGGVAILSQDNLVEELIIRNKATVVYTVTVTGPTAPDVGNKYNLNGEYNPALNLVVGYTYVFNQDDLTNVYFPNENGTTLNPHPINFSSDDLNGELGDGTSYTTDVIYRLDNVTVTKDRYNGVAFNTATKREVWLTITSNTPEILYYYCANHLNMGETITNSNPGTGSGTAAPSDNVTVSVSDTVPTSPSNGSLWLNTNNGSLYVYITDEDGSQWIQPSVPYPEPTSGAPDSSMFPPFELYVAADDSTKFSIDVGNTIQIIGAGGITTAVDADGIFTITGSGQTGNIVFDANSINTSDSSAITIVPATFFNSDVTVENKLFVRNKIVAPSFETDSPGVPEVYSASTLNLTAENAVAITQSPLRLAQFTTTERNLLAAQNGDVIYNSSTNKFQGYENGSWVNLI
jgi:hypothetical protein